MHDSTEDAEDVPPELAKYLNLCMLPNSSVSEGTTFSLGEMQSKQSKYNAEEISGSTCVTQTNEMD
eukprot:768086-Hanusia_phi.AAC.2